MSNNLARVRAMQKAKGSATKALDAHHLLAYMVLQGSTRRRCASATITIYHMGAISKPKLLMVRLAAAVASMNASSATKVTPIRIVLTRSDY